LRRLDASGKGKRLDVKPAQFEYHLPSTVAEVLELRLGREGREDGYTEEGDRVEVRWMTRDTYRRDMGYQQSCALSLEESGKARREREENGDVVGELCYLEGRMDGLDYRRSDWACTGIKFC